MRAPALIFTVAFLLRLLHLLAFRHVAFYRLPFGDSQTFAQEAARLAGGGLFSGDLPFFQGPLYPLLLAAIRGLGLPLQAAFWLQCLTGSLSAVLVYLLARRVTSQRAGIFAGLLYAAYDAAIFFDADLLAISLVVTLVLCGLVLTQRAWAAGESTRTVHRFGPVIAGIAMGLAAWGRPNLAIPVLVLALWPFVRRLGRAKRHLPLALSATAVLLLPMLRNLAVSGEPIFIASGGGVNFFIGNHRGATGTFRMPPRSGLTNDLELERLSREVASRESGRPLSPGQTSSFWFRRGIADLVADPGAALRLYGRKLLLLAHRREIPNHLDIGFVRHYSLVLRWDPIRAWLLLALGTAGLALAATRRAALPLVIFAIACAISILPFFATARYRLPIMPILAAGAGIFLDAVGDRAHQDQGKRLIAASLAGIAILIVSFLPVVKPASPVMAHVNLGALHADLGEEDRAEAEFRRALEIAPGDPRALENLGVLALRRGDAASGLSLIERAIEAEPNSFSVWNRYGIALAMLKRYDEAIAAFEESLALYPDWAEARANLAGTWQEYLRVCDRVVREAGLLPPEGPEDLRHISKLLSDNGFLRAAAKILESLPADTSAAAPP